MFIFVFFCVIFAALTAVPYTALGNINIPDAYVLPHLMAEISFTNYFVKDPVAYEDDDEYHHNLGGAVNFGILNRGELGLVIENNDLIYANAKVRIVSETEKIPAFAVGIDNLFSRRANFDVNKGIPEEELADPEDFIKNSPYFVISKSTLLLTNFSLFSELETVFHLGIGARKYQGKGEIVKNAAGFFGGADLRFSELVGMNFEFDSKNINMGINLFYSNFTLRAGLFEIEDFFNIKDDNSGRKFAVNLKYTLDVFSQVKASEKDSYQKDLAPQTPRPATQTYRPAAISDTEEDSLLQELRKITERRKEAEKELEEIKKLLQEE